MTKRIVPVLLLVLLLTSGYAQNVTTDTSTTCVTFWRKGEVKNIAITRTSNIKEPNKAKKVSSGKVTCEATIKVLDSTETSYTIQWQYKKGKTEGASKDDDLIHLFTDLKIIYTTSATGVFDSLVNYEEVRNAITETARTISSIVSRPVSYRAFHTYDILLKSRPATERLILQDIMQYHSPYGLDYTFRPEVEETEVPNVFGGEPFPALLSLSLLKLQPWKDFAQLGIEQKIDREKAKPIFMDIVKKFTAASDSNNIDANMFPAMAVNDQFVYNLRLSDGWMKRMNMKRTIITLEGTKTETTEIILK